MEKVIHYPCGFVVKGQTDDQIVRNAQKHAAEVHQMTLSREEALSMATPLAGESGKTG